MPETPMSDSAARTSSSLNGLMIAVTSFIVLIPRPGTYRPCYAGQSIFAVFMPFAMGFENHGFSGLIAFHSGRIRTIAERGRERPAPSWCGAVRNPQGRLQGTGSAGGGDLCKGPAGTSMRIEANLAQCNTLAATLPS